MNQVTEPLLQKMVDAIVAEVDPEQVILFGSRARGDAREDSDVDLIVLESEPFGEGRSRHKEEVRLYSALSRFRVPADVLVYSREDVEYWRDSLNNVLARALWEGRVLYEILASFPLDPPRAVSDAKQARVLIEAANRDLSALRGMDDADIFADEIFGFHTQQAAEKLLKAWLALLGEVYPLTHNLELLLDRLQKRDVSVERLRPFAKYTPYAGRLRYGALEPITEPLDRVAALRQVGALIEEVRRQMVTED